MGSIKKSLEREMFCKFPSTVLALALLATLCSPAVSGRGQWRKRVEGKIDDLIKATTQVFKISTTADPRTQIVTITEITYEIPSCGVTTDFTFENNGIDYEYVDTMSFCGQITITATLDGVPCGGATKPQGNFEIIPVAGSSGCQILAK